jgi:hypothetical protein
LFCPEVTQTKRFTVFSAVSSTTPNPVSGVMCQISASPDQFIFDPKSVKKRSED